MTTNEEKMIEDFFGIDASTGIESSSDDNCFDFWEGKDCNDEYIIVNLSTCEWTEKGNDKYRAIK